MLGHKKKRRIDEKECRRASQNQREHSPMDSHSLWRDDHFVAYFWHKGKASNENTEFAKQNSDM
jgi:hypothetical protein